jgi:hypothetical protein
VHHPGLQFANGKGLTVLEQMVEGRTVGGHGAVVEHLAEHLLHVLDVLANGNLAAEHLFQIGRGRKMVRVGVAFEQPVHGEPLIPHEADDLVGEVGFGAAGGVIEVEHAVENCAVAVCGSMMQWVAVRWARETSSERWGSAYSYGYLLGGMRCRNTIEKHILFFH